MSERETRQIELDILRIIALFAVITVHCTGMGMSDIPMTDLSHQILIFVDSIVTWQVPIYVMISGRFFLDPERSVTKSKIKKSIIHLVVAFVVWDVVYQMYYIVSGTYSGLNWKGIIFQAIIGPYHFWYLFMAIGLYAITPFLRLIADHKRMIEYYIVLFLMYELLAGYGSSLPVIGTTITEVLSKMDFHFAVGYSGYFILGYYLYKYKLSTRKELLLYGLGIVLLITAGVATVNRAVIEEVNNEWYTKYLLLNITIEAAALYTLFVKRVRKIRFPDMVNRIVVRVSKLSFGVYLVHALVANVVADMGFSVAGKYVLLKLLTGVGITFLISCCVTWIVRKIPCIGSYIT